MSEAEIQAWADTLVASTPEVALGMWSELQHRSPESEVAALAATSTCGKSVSEELVKASWTLVGRPAPTGAES